MFKQLERRYQFSLIITNYVEILLENTCSNEVEFS